MPAARFPCDRSTEVLRPQIPKPSSVRAHCSCLRTLQGRRRQVPSPGRRPGLPYCPAEGRWNGGSAVTRCWFPGPRRHRHVRFLPSPNYFSGSFKSFKPRRHACNALGRVRRTPRTRPGVSLQPDTGPPLPALAWPGPRRSMQTGPPGLAKKFFIDYCGPTVAGGWDAL